jgi:hypothetical protein
MLDPLARFLAWITGGERPVTAEGWHELAAETTSRTRRVFIETAIAIGEPELADEISRWPDDASFPIAEFKDRLDRIERRAGTRALAKAQRRA